MVLLSPGGALVITRVGPGEASAGFLAAACGGQHGEAGAEQGETGRLGDSHGADLDGERVVRKRVDAGVRPRVLNEASLYVAVSVSDVPDT
jgi:hypothetical protein